MRSPLDPRFRKIQLLHQSGQMVGKDRPVGRVTFSKQRVNQLATIKSGVDVVRFLDKHPTESEVFGVRSIDIDRSIGQDAQTCTISMFNIRPDSTRPEGVDTAGTAGYLTTGHGDSLTANTSVYDGIDGTNVSYPTKWGYAQNPYRDVFIPNTVLRTYQGYGSDNFDASGNPYFTDNVGYVAPKDDTQLYQSGVWLIDKVTYTAEGTLTIECRDLAKLLIEQYIYPPMIPTSRFPLIYCPAHGSTGHKEQIGKNIGVLHSASTDTVYGKNGSVNGHRSSDAFDTKPDTYWWSGPDSSTNNVEWLQAKCHGPINEVVLQTWGAQYTAYVCVNENGKWQGTSTVSGNSENLPYRDSPGEGVDGFFYVITSGDTLWDLAGTYYGNNLLWPIIAEANNNIIVDPHWIYPGQRIKIPYVEGTKSPPPGGTGGTGGTHVTIPYVARFAVPSTGKVTMHLPRTYGTPMTELTVIGAPSGGVFRVTVNNKETGGIAHNASPAALQSALVALPNIEPGDVSVTKSGAVYRLVWKARLAGESPTVKADGRLLTGGSSPTVTVHNAYKDVFVRVVLTNLYPWQGNYRTGIRTMNVRNHVLNTYVPGNIGKAGYITDWTEPIKELCAWAGLTWEDATPNPADAVIGRTKDGKPLRVWGDFEFLGAGPVVCTPGDYFMSKSFMEGIRQIGDFIGGVFFIDETGGAQFRLPNVWTGGNFINDTSAASTLGARISEHPIEFHEDANLISYQMVINDQSVRSEILVIGGYPGVNSKGPVAGGYVLGYNSVTHQTSAIDFTDILAGQYRLMVVPGDSTKLFYTELECQRMAELTALFILFTYRQGTLTAPAHPGLQLDDQVRIFERTTYETNIHYVSSIRTHQDLESGEYTMELATHWLGKDPDTEWFVNKAQLTPAVKSLPAILARVGREAGGDQFEQPPFGT